MNNKNRLLSRISICAAAAPVGKNHMVDQLVIGFLGWLLTFAILKFSSNYA